MSTVEAKLTEAKALRQVAANYKAYVETTQLQPADAKRITQKYKDAIAQAKQLEQEAKREQG